MFEYARKTKYPTDKQAMIWNLKRNNLTGEEIAKKENVTPGFVSKTLKETNKRIKGLLENAARMNKITLEILNEELGIARGHSHVLNMQVFITYSPVNGVQVWYEHEGDCVSCKQFSECREALIQEFKERNLPVPSPTLRPTDLSDILLEKIAEMLE
ncbi:MAG: hypothetical protein ACFFD4_13360 [Candidatus Odinarchaeota archaeon]